MDFPYLLHMGSLKATSSNDELVSNNEMRKVIQSPSYAENWLHTMSWTSTPHSSERESHTSTADCQRTNLSGHQHHFRFPGIPRTSNITADGWSTRDTV
ncbi:hypothetical protein FKM82_021275 [Ascaphus truei]